MESDWQQSAFLSKQCAPFLLLSLFVLGALAVVPLKKEPLEKPLGVRPAVHSPKWKLLSRALKKDLPEISTVTEDVLKTLIDTECDTLDFIPFLDKICDKLVDFGLDKLFDLIVKQDGKIDPQHDCQAVKLC
ncbi:Saposin B-type domain-containing protein [Aphelenchoides fujianensis]|nr:Saposin B-type domain-containing protein [Aphelenchoides fujianensis]